MNELRPIAVLEAQLINQTDELKKVLPAHISPERFIAVAKTAVLENPDLIGADRASLFKACRRAAQDGLLPDGQDAVFVVYKDKVQYQPMYQGLLKLFRNSGQFRHVGTGIVYEGEEFQHWIDEDGEHFRHVPGDDRDPRKVRRVYATATTKDGGYFIVDMSKSEVDKHKAQSRATREDAPWRKWEQAMQRKTALRVLSKLLPKSSDLEQTLRQDEEELYGVEAASSAPDRPTDTRMALDAFGAADLGESTVPEGGGMVEAGSPDVPQTTDDAVSAAQGSVSHPPNFLASALTAESIAYARGKKDRARGVQRRAVPGEYREGDDAAAMALAWQRGWDDGK